MATNIKTPYILFNDLDGQPLENGKIYIGSAGLDPATNAITVYSDASLSTSVAQPISTTAGIPYVSGSPVRLYVAETDFSLRVSNTNNTTIHEDLNAGANQGIYSGISVDSSGNVKIGDQTFAARGVLDVTDGSIILDNTSAGLAWENDGGTVQNVLLLGDSGGNFRIFTGTTASPSEAIRVNASAEVGINEDSPQANLHITDSTGGCGVILESAENSTCAVTFGEPSDVSRGDILYDNNTNYMAFRTNNLTEAIRLDSIQRLLPGTDNGQTFGAAGLRWSELFAGNGTINTSDEREKTQVEVDQKVLAAVNSISVKAFKWNDAVEEKGDGARVHYGVIAQEVKAAFEAQGLVAEDYGVLCYDEWGDRYDKKVVTEGKPAVLDEEGNEIEPAVEEVTEQVLSMKAGNRYGVRYDELYAMKIAALEARITALESV